MAAPLTSQPSTLGGRTLRAIAAAATDDPDAIIRPREFIELAYVPGIRPSLACRRLMLLLLAESGAAAVDDVAHRIERRRLPGHRSFQDFQLLIQELKAISLLLPVGSWRGRRAVRTSGIFLWVQQEEDQSGTAWVEWRLTDEARSWIRKSEVYARLSREVVNSLRSSYSLELYQWAALLSGRDHPRWAGSLDDLRVLLGAGDMCWRDLRREALGVAAKELRRAAFDIEIEITRRRGRAVQSVCLHFRALPARLRKTSCRQAAVRRVPLRERAIAILLQRDHYQRDAWRCLAIKRGAPADAICSPTHSALGKWVDWIARDLCAQDPTMADK